MKKIALIFITLFGSILLYSQSDYKHTCEGELVEHSQSKSTSFSRENIKMAQSELESLPGIGDVIARRIIQARPFSYKSEFKNVKGIGKKRYQGIKDKVVY